MILDGISLCDTSYILDCAEGFNREQRITGQNQFTEKCANLEKTSESQRNHWNRLFATGNHFWTATTTKLIPKLCCAILNDKCKYAHGVGL